MKYTASVAVAAALASHSVSGHYIFQSLQAGTASGTPYEFVRQNTNMNSPVLDLDSDDMRCNVGGATGGSTQTLTLKAGDEFTFTLDQAVYHQGPVSLYMSKATGAVGEYDGSGDWFKIKDWAPDFSSGQAVWTMSDAYTYNIPTCIPDGEYLLRIQSLAIHNPGSTPQWYIECGQVLVQGGGTATPSPLVKIPGAFKTTDPGYTANIYSDFHEYIVPGPEEFTC